ncbi:tyrosine-type recombinase/integrase [Magnetovibrio blakemorei]|nr:site-specific integrase [Magnetovibrio blakemorei]
MGKTVRKSARTMKKTEALQFLMREMDTYKRWVREGRRYHIVQEMIDKYRVEHMPSLKITTRKSYAGNIRQLSPHFAHLDLEKISKGNITEFISARRRDGATSPTIRRDLSVFSSMLSCAVVWDWLDVNPVKNYDKRSIRENPPRIRYLTRGEYQRLVDAASDYMKPMITLAVQTGMRVGEILSLKWSRVDLQRREILLLETKSNRPRVIPLSDNAVTTLVTILRHPTSDYVFHKEDGERYIRIVIGFRGAVRRAGIENFRFHDLRHTFASWAVQSGMDLYRLSRILGHSTMDMSTRYAHLATADLHRAIHEMGSFMGTNAENAQIQPSEATPSHLGLPSLDATTPPRKLH